MSNATENKTAEAVKDRWPRRILAFLVTAALLFYLLKGCLWFVAPNGGHWADHYEVISVVPRPDGRMNAVEFKYTYAELSSTGISVWFLEGKAPAIGSTKIPGGQPAFTYLAGDHNIRWSWNRDAKLEVRFPGSADIMVTTVASSCFWDLTLPRLCIHSPDVVLKKD